MKNPFIFASTCPTCRQKQSQRGHTRRALVRLIESRQTIDAYCLDCDIVWPVTAEERVAIGCAVEMSKRGTTPAEATPWIYTVREGRETACHRT
jgi:hypothetical protein